MTRLPDWTTEKLAAETAAAVAEVPKDALVDRLPPLPTMVDASLPAAEDDGWEEYVLARPHGTWTITRHDSDRVPRGVLFVEWWNSLPVPRGC